VTISQQIISDPISDLDGLSGITAILSEDLIIQNNPALNDVSGLDNLLSVNGMFSFINNDGIFNLNGFNNLEIRNTTTISGNDALLILSGLNNFDGGEDLIITDNGGLTVISGLGNIELDDNLEITNNASLNNISGLTTTNFVPFIIITGNSSLSECDTDYICDNLDSSTFPMFTFSSNGGTCNSFAEVEAQCLLPFPVELVNIRAEKSGSSVVLSWLTASEINNQGFEINRSHDGRSWETIGYENGAGSTLAATQYRFLDENPLGGTNYYRLKQIDYDGVFEYSPTVIITIATKFEEKAINVFPNPTTGPVTLQIKNERQERSLIRISDSFGRLIFEERFNAGEMDTNYTKTLDLAEMEMYFIYTQIGNQISVEKIRVQNID